MSLKFDAFPAIVNPDVINLMGLKRGQPVVADDRAVIFDLVRSNTAAGAVDDIGDDIWLEGVAEGSVHFAGKLGRTGDTGIGAHGQARGVLLDDGGDRDQILPRDAGGGDVFLVADGKIGLAGGHQGFGRGVLRVGQDGKVQPLLLIPALLLGDIDAGVVGVGGVIKGDGDRREML